MTMEAAEKSPAETDVMQSIHNNNNNQSKPDGNGSGDAERQPPPVEQSCTTDEKNTEHGENGGEIGDEDDALDLGDTSDYDASARSALFQRGLDYEQKGKQDLALKCYFGCLKGLKRKTYFALLPECLHNIADVYQAKENYERAIHFAQAEKLFYESALIESQEIQKKIEEVAVTENDRPATDLNELNIEAMRADEYEHLARLCLDKNQAQLALEYAGKCAKIRQLVYGENHPKTKETLDFFASLYAEVGKEQYSDSFTLLDAVTSDEYQAPQVIMSPHPGGEPVSILRQRTMAKGQQKKEESPEQTEREKKQVRFHQSVEDRSRRDKGEIMTNVLILCVAILVFILGLTLT